VIGGMFRAPHGAVCAALLPHVKAMNRRALQERARTVRWSRVTKKSPAF
jgi:alcohol dehydrogenase class IV